MLTLQDFIYTYLDEGQEISVCLVDNDFETVFEGRVADLDLDNDIFSSEIGFIIGNDNKIEIDI